MTTESIKAKIAQNEILTDDERTLLADHDIDALLEYEQAERIAKITPEAILRDKIISQSVEILSNAKDALYTQASNASDRDVQSAIYAAIDAVDAQIKTIHGMQS
jgi:hypothetical protein